jgi:hypothetical protein
MPIDYLKERTAAESWLLTLPRLLSEGSDVLSRAIKELRRSISREYALTCDIKALEQEVAALRVRLVEMEEGT